MSTKKVTKKKELPNLMRAEPSEVKSLAFPVSVNENFKSQSLMDVELI